MPRQNDILGQIRSTGRTPTGDARLAAMLRHDDPVYSRRSTAQAERLRGEILAAFAGREIPAAVLSAIREELGTSLSPIVLTGAARALRGSPAMTEDLQILLQAAGERLAARDEYVSLGAEQPAPMTVRQEIAAAIGVPTSTPRPSCCTGSTSLKKAARPSPQRRSLCPKALGRVTIEDQDRTAVRLLALLDRGPCLIAPFYTRCMNPAKCSLTITRLAAFARFAVAEPRGRDVMVLGLSYDGAFDQADRLGDYGRDRAFPFGERARLIRCRTGWDAVRRQFGLSVGYGEATVNDHARELFLLLPGLDLVALDNDLLDDAPALLDRIAQATSGADAQV